MARCMDVLKICNSYPDAALCATAETACMYEVAELEVGIGGRNPFDSK